MSTRPTVAIFAGSRAPNDKNLIQAAETLGRQLGEAGFNINYGAGTEGLMGAVALAAARAGAEVNAMVLQKYAHERQVPGAHLFPIASEQERFSLLSTHNRPVALIMLPGGPGSLREALQGLEGAIYDNGPPVILITNGDYIGGIRTFFTKAVEGGLIKQEYDPKVLRYLDVKDVVENLTTIIGKPVQNKGAPAKNP